MANAGERPKFLRWGHGEPPSEYLWHSSALGPETSLQRLVRIGMCLLAYGVLAGMDLNTRFAQQALRKPVCAGTATAAVVAFFVNRGCPAGGYKHRRKSSSGGQRIGLDSVAPQRRFSFWHLAICW